MWIGPYQIQGEIARGGMGAVFKGWTPQGDPIALKVLLRGAQASGTQRRRFEREVEALASLDHRAIVRVHGAGEHEGQPYLVMELVEGETLQGVLLDHGPLDVAEAAGVAAELARALEHAHARGVLHRDLKPDNLIRTRAGRIKLTDFGLSRGVDPGAHTQLSVSGLSLGTPGYWAPEQARGERDATGPATDVYGLGAVLYALLTGEPPIDGDDLVEITIATQERAPRPPSELRPEVDRTLEAICLRCLEKEPARRYPSARAAAEALEEYLAGEAPEPPSARARPTTTRGAGAGAARARSGRPRLIAWAALLALGSAALGLSVQRAADARAVLRAREAAELGPVVWLQRGHAHYAREEWGKAVLAYGHYLEAGGEPHPILFANRADARSRLADFRGSMTDLGIALADRPKNPGYLLAYTLRVNLLMEIERRPRAALAAVEELLAAYPDHADAYATRASLRLQLDDPAGAAGDVARAEELGPEYADTYVFLAHYWDRQQERRRALARIDTAARLDPDNARILSNRGGLKMKMGDLAGARVDILRALELAPNDPLALANHASLVGREGDPTRARALFERARKLVAPSNPLRAQLDREVKLLDRMLKERGAPSPPPPR